MTYVQVTAVVKIPFDDELTEMHAKASDERRQEVLDYVSRSTKEELLLSCEDGATVEVTAEYKEEGSE
jgi:hypothetical protein